MAAFCQHYRLHFRDPELLRLALTHRSYLSVTGRGGRESNERLEFLGDSVLGLVTSEHLFRTNPTEHEGQLTKTKSLLVSKAILARRALNMGLGRFVFMSHSEIESGGRQRLSILADAFESVIGAIYLDQGFEPARTFIHEHLLADAREIAADKRHTNYKSHLQEYVQSTFRTHPIYRIRREMGPDHSKQFVVDVMVGRRVLGTGRGQNKKDAEQAAARDALAQVATPRSEEPREPRRQVSRRPPRAEAPVVEETATLDEEAPAKPEREPRREPERRPARELPARSVPSAPSRIEAARLAAQSAPATDSSSLRPGRAPEVPPGQDEVDLEIGRPEGPLEELHVDPYGIDERASSTETPAGRSPDFGRSVVTPLSRFATPDADEPSSASEPEPTPPVEGKPGGGSQRYGRRPGRRR